jgi:hypothetical protein
MTTRDPLPAPATLKRSGQSNGDASLTARRCISVFRLGISNTMGVVRR